MYSLFLEALHEIILALLNYHKVKHFLFFKQIFVFSIHPQKRKLDLVGIKNKTAAVDFL